MDIQAKLENLDTRLSALEKRFPTPPSKEEVAAFRMEISAFCESVSHHLAEDDLGVHDVVRTPAGH